jgi:hypothetical protein
MEMGLILCKAAGGFNFFKYKNKRKKGTAPLFLLFSSLYMVRTSADSND